MILFNPISEVMISYDSLIKLTFKLNICKNIAITGSVEHGSQYAVKLVYEHLLERTSCNFVVGSFGGVKGILNSFFCLITQKLD